MILFTKFTNKWKTYFCVKKINHFLNKPFSTASSCDSFGGSFTEKEQQYILKYLNNLNDDDSSKIKINERQTKSIKRFLNKNKTFKNIEELINLNGFGLKSLHKICKQILEEPDLPKKSSGHDYLKSNLVTPFLDVNVAHNINSVIGLDISNFYLSWTRLDYSTKTITDWKVVDFCEDVDTKKLFSIYEFVTNLRKEIPTSDVYVIENTNWSTMNSQTSLVQHIRAAQTTALLLSLLNLRNNENNANLSDGLEKLYQNNKVYFLRAYLPTRYFKTLIGLERVSPQNMVEEMFNCDFPNYCTNINVNQDCKDFYFHNAKPRRESLCQSFLLTIAFMELILLNKVDVLKPKKRLAKYALEGETE